MLLDKIKQLHQDCKGMSERDQDFLGFPPNLAGIETVQSHILQGKWSALHFSARYGVNQTLGIRIFPHIPDKEWPVYRLWPQGEFCAANMRVFLLDNLVGYLNEFRDECQKYYDNFDRVSELILPTFKLFGGGEEDIEELKHVVFNKENWPVEGPKLDASRLAKYREFSLRKDPCYGNNYLWKLLDKLIKDQHYMPEPATGDLGIYEPRIKYLIAWRASYMLNRELKYYGIQLGHGLIMPHGYDLDSEDPDYYPDSGRVNRFVLKDFARNFWDNERTAERPKELESYPECFALKRMGEREVDGLDGTTLLEAAAELDEKYNQPIRAWNCLVSAGFWAGGASRDAGDLKKLQDVIIRAAIFLCEKHGWLEAREVLRHNHDIMHSA